MVLRENLYGFQGNQQSPYLKITVTDPKFINKVRTTIESGNANWKGMWKGVDGTVMTFDSIQYVLRFMVDTKLAGMSWVEVPTKSYKLINENERQSNCQIEAEVSYRDLIAHKPEGEWSKMAPLRILSFDIECAGRKVSFQNQTVILSSKSRTWLLDTVKRNHSSGTSFASILRVLLSILKSLSLRRKRRCSWHGAIFSKRSIPTSLLVTT